MTPSEKRALSDLNCATRKLEAYFESLGMREYTTIFANFRDYAAQLVAEGKTREAEREAYKAFPRKTVSRSAYRQGEASL